MDGLEGLDRQNIEVVESFARDGGAEPMFYDADLEVFEQEEEPLKVIGADNDLLYYQDFLKL